MKVYQVIKPFYDGDTGHGIYQSPLFESEELAKEFLSLVWGISVTEEIEWGCSNDEYSDNPPVIVLVETTNILKQIDDSRTYLSLVSA